MPRSTTEQDDKRSDAPKDNLVPSDDEDNLETVENAQARRPQIAKDLRTEADDVRPSRG